jgi:hypothetical protein
VNPTDKMLAWAQISLSALFLLGTFIIIGLYELGYAHLTADQSRSFDSVISWLTGADLIIIYFWFQRQRTAGIPDASSTVTQTTTAADGSKTVITSPAGPTPAPAVATVPVVAVVPAPAPARAPLPIPPKDPPK